MKQYKWKILSLWAAPHENGLNEVVKSIDWCFRVTEKLNYGEKYETTKLTSPSTDSYIKYEDLKEETIIGWIKNNINYEELVSEVDLLLEKNKNPDVVEKTNPPWQQNDLWPFIANRQYLMVIDDEINNTEKTHGPMFWDSVDFNDVLKQKFELFNIEIPDNATIGFKQLLPHNDVIHITDRVKIYSVINIEPDYDGKFEKLEVTDWEIIDSVAYKKYNVVELTPDESKNQLLSLDIGNWKYQCGLIVDELTDLLVLQFTINNSDNETIEWTIDGVFDFWTKEQLKDLVKTKTKELYALTKQKQQTDFAINRCQSIQELKEKFQKNNR